MTQDKNIYPEHLAVACSIFSHETYELECLKEIVSLSLDNDFANKFTHAIYCDEMQIRENIFMPRFHTYYLNSDAKHVIILDEQMIDLPETYTHHKYYVYANDELFKKLSKSCKNIKNIQSIKEIINVSANE